MNMLFKAILKFCTTNQLFNSLICNIRQLQLQICCYRNLLGNSKAPGNPNTCDEVKLYLFLSMPALEIVCCKNEVLNKVSSA